MQNSRFWGVSRLALKSTIKFQHISLELPCPSSNYNKTTLLWIRPCSRTTYSRTLRKSNMLIYGNGNPPVSAMVKLPGTPPRIEDFPLPRLTSGYLWCWHLIPYHFDAFSHVWARPNMLRTTIQNGSQGACISMHTQDKPWPEPPRWSFLCDPTDISKHSGVLKKKRRTTISVAI